MTKRDLSEIIERYEHLSFMIHKKGELLINEQIQSHLTHDQHITLHYIRKQAHCTSSDLAQLFHVNKSAITALTNRLVEKGLIDRQRDKEDRRLVHLSLTKKGEALYLACYEKIHSVVEGFITQFSEEEIETFMITYEKLAVILDQTIQVKTD